MADPPAFFRNYNNFKRRNKTLYIIHHNIVIYPYSQLNSEEAVEDASHDEKTFVLVGSESKIVVPPHDPCESFFGLKNIKNGIPL
jgi:hypothetical protein